MHEFCTSKEIYTLQGLHQLNQISERIIRYSESDSIFLFYGDMGAGKTTLIQHICEHMGTLSPVSSPTFSIVNEYTLSSGHKIYHFDFYRIKDEIEALDIGLEEYLSSGQYCFIEWPERIEALLPSRYVKVNIILNNDNTRTITISTHEG